MPDVSESIRVNADRHTVYNLISDLPRMGEWSPECTGITWRGKLRAPVTGARFIGHNRSGRLRWWTLGHVVAATPGTHFAFEIAIGPVKVARWEYWFEDADGACTVTEQWTERRPQVGGMIVDKVFGPRARANRRNMRKTLEEIKVAAER